MKKLTILTLSFMLLNFGLLKAQTNQTNFLVGVSSNLNLTSTGADFMNIGYSFTKYKSNTDGTEVSDPIKKGSFNLSPRMAYFAIDNLAVGLDINTAISIEKLGTNFNNEKLTETLLSGGPFVRYYITSFKVFPLIEANSSFGMMKTKYNFSDIDQNMEFNYGVISYGGGIGMAVPLGQNASFDVLCAYNSIVLRNKEYDYSKITGTFCLRLGFAILFAK
jgi:outer membrane protein